MSILFITHDIGQACYVSDRIMVMSQGEVVEAGPTDEVIFNPQHEYTRRLLDDVPKLHEDEGDRLRRSCRRDTLTSTLVEVAACMHDRTRACSTHSTGSATPGPNSRDSSPTTARWPPRR